MDNSLDQLAPSRKTAANLIYKVLGLIRDAGGHLPGKEIFDFLRVNVEFTDWEKDVYETTGNVRWESILHLTSVTFVKAGFLRKNKRSWYITAEGEKALSLGAVKLFETANDLYRNWAVNHKANRHNKAIPASDETDLDALSSNVPEIQKANLEQITNQAFEGINLYIRKKSPYDFQNMVAALLRAMGYYTPFISPKGKDGGLDILAYNDPLGATAPRLKVQIKHKPDSSVPVDDIRSLTGLLNKDGDIGLFVTSGDFTAESERLARESHRHIRLINIDSFIELWQEFYPKMSDEDKNMLPLQPIYFLGSNE